MYLVSTVEMGRQFEGRKCSPEREKDFRMGKDGRASDDEPGGHVDSTKIQEIFSLI